MKIRPLHDRILIKRLDEEEKSKGGIIIPDTGKEKPIQGKVVPPDVKEGSKVLFGKYAGTEVKIDGEEHLLMRENDILAVVEE